MIFSHYYSTSEPSSKKGKYPPIKVNISTYEVFSKVVNYLNENGYGELKANEEYYDIFATRDGYEASILVVSDGGESLIQISIYYEKKFNHVKRLFKEIYNDLEELFSNYA